PKGHPTKNVVTFDGLKANGQAYDISATNPGEVDVLTSRPIDLSNVQPGDSLYLSFFYQGGGFGEGTDAGNQLFIEFLRGNDVDWLQPLEGGVILGNEKTAFRQHIVYVPRNSTSPNLTLYHDKFQFRLRTVGFQGGSGDVWNVDYVYLNTGRNRGDTIFFDVATTQTPTSLLTPYTAMPIKHYLHNPGSYTSEEVIQGGANLNSDFRISQFRANIINRETGNQVQKKDSIQYFEEFSRHTIPVEQTSNSVIDNTDERRVLEYKFHFISPAIDPEPFENRFNDTISRYHVLSDYFAYDDGSAERSYRPNDATQIAIKFVPAINDTLKAVSFYFVPFLHDLLGSSIMVKVWGVDSNGQPDLNNVLAQKSVGISYGELNQFKRVNLDDPVPVSGPFFVGWSQTFGNKALLGFDMNTDSKQFRYYNVGGVWHPDLNEGSLMVRAMMGGSPLAGAPVTFTEAPAIKVYPNPGNGIFNLSHQAEILELYDLNGRRLSVTNHVINNRIDLRGMPAGLYLVRVRHQNQVSTHKLMLQPN
ncbi:MAG: T9SS type A sorting domain-containing protein, partial [Sphingobacteriales bacterium]